MRERSISARGTGRGRVGRSAAAAAGLLAGAWGTCAVAQLRIDPVALSGWEAPGTGGQPYGLLRTPVINDAGQVLFGAAETEAQLSRTGLWAGAPGALQLVARPLDPAPDLPETFEFIYNSQLDAAGRVLLDTTTDQHIPGLWFGPPGGLQTLMFRTSPAPGFEPGWDVGGPSGARLSPTGAAASIAYMVGPMSEGAGAIYVSGGGGGGGAPGALQLVARSGDAAPGLADGSTFVLDPALRGTPSIDRAGRVAFAAEALVPGSPAGESTVGIWSGAPGVALQLVAAEGEAAPGAGAGVVFAEVVPDGQFPRIAAGRVAFAGTVTGAGVGAEDDRGVWAGLPGAIQLAAREGSGVAGGAPGLLYGEPGAVALNSSGELAFAGGLAGDGVDASSDRGLFLGPAGAVALVVREGQPAPAGGGATFADFGDPSINEAGALAFLATLAGAGVGEANDVALFLRDELGTLHLVAREGEALLVGPGDARTVLGLSIFEGASAGEDGLPSSFNNAGQIAFRANFADGSSGVFIASVPEPAGAAGLAIGAIGLLGRRRGGR